MLKTCLHTEGDWMKLLLCKDCCELIQMTSEIKRCSCGKVQGRYQQDGMTLEVNIVNPMNARVVGISNSFLSEDRFDFDHPSFEGTIFKREQSHIIMVYPYTTGDVVPMER